MQLDFMVVVSNLVGLFLMMAVGYAAAKSGTLDASASRIMTALLLKLFRLLIRFFRAHFTRNLCRMRIRLRMRRRLRKWY